jgi:hypothetical protein
VVSGRRDAPYRTPSRHRMDHLEHGKRNSRSSECPYMPVLSQNVGRPSCISNCRPCVIAVASWGSSLTTWKACSFGGSSPASNCAFALCAGSSAAATQTATSTSTIAIPTKIFLHARMHKPATSDSLNARHMRRVSSSAGRDNPQKPAPNPSVSRLFSTLVSHIYSLDAILSQRHGL